MTTAIDRSAYGVPSVTAAQEADSRQRGDVLRMKTDTDYMLRFMPAFVQRDGSGIWWSFGKRHYKVPGANTDSKLYTYDCPQHAMAGRCITCEHEQQFIDAGRWAGRTGCMGKLHVRFNVIDAKSPANGVQILEDTITLYRMLTTALERNGSIMDPFDGKVMGVIKLTDTPWRQFFDVELKGVNPGGYCSLDVLHDDAFEWAKMVNLPDLDASWSYPTWEKQMEVFGSVIKGITESPEQVQEQEQERLPAPSSAPTPIAEAIVSGSPTEAAPVQSAPVEQGNPPSAVMLALQKAKDDAAKESGSA